MPEHNATLQVGKCQSNSLTNESFVNECSAGTIIEVIYDSLDCTGNWKSMRKLGRGDMCNEGIDIWFNTNMQCRYDNTTKAIKESMPNSNSTNMTEADSGQDENRPEVLDQEFLDRYIYFIIGQDEYQNLYMKYKPPKGSSVDPGWPGMLPGKIDISNLNWMYSSSIFFVITIITTIGYGTFAPETPGGMVFTIAFAFIGIAYFGITLGLVGHNLIACIKGTAKTICHRDDPHYRLSAKRTLAWATLALFFYISMIGVACNIMDAEEWPIGIAMWCEYFSLCSGSYDICGSILNNFWYIFPLGDNLTYLF